MESSKTKGVLLFGKWCREGDLDLTDDERYTYSCRRATEAKNKRRAKSIELDVSIWGMLDDYLLEKIIARLPLKSLFQASSLSKTWRLKFQSTSFQNEVHNAAASWESFSPLFVNHRSGLLVGYESRLQRYSRLPTHSYLPQASFRWSLAAVDGSLLCWISVEVIDKYADEQFDPSRILVGNPMTKSWKLLPPHRVDTTDTGYWDYYDEWPHNRAGIVLVIREGRAAYKVILVSVLESASVTMCIQIFDSTDGFWTVEYYTTEAPTRTIYDPELRREGSAVMNGVLYMLVRRRGIFTDSQLDNYKLISLDMKKKMCKENDFPCPVVTWSQFDQLVVCGSNLMLVMRAYGPVGDLSDCVTQGVTLHVFRVDPKTLLLSEVSRAPNTENPYKNIFVEAGHGDCIYVGSDSPYFETTIPYNVGTQEWGTERIWLGSAESDLSAFSCNRCNSCKMCTSWDCRSFRYQPGLDPFFKI